MENKMTEVAEEQTEELKSSMDDMDSLRSQVKGLNEELTETKEKLATAQTELAKSKELRMELDKKLTTALTDLAKSEKLKTEADEQLTTARMELAKSEELRTEAEKCISELRKKVETLRQEVNGLHKAAKKSVVDVGCQINQTSTATSTEGATGGNAMQSDWAMEVGTSSVTQSVADSVRAVATAAATRSGFVLDQNTGMYYDCNTGYYYDQVNKLYYDSNSGIYYYFDERTGSYQFHSQVELPASTQQGQRERGRGGASGKRKERRRAEERREADDRRRETLDDMDCQIIEMRQDTRRGHKRRRKDASRDQTRSSSERDGSAVPQRAHRDRRRMKEHRIRSHREDGDKVETITSEHAHQHKKRMHSREQRRKQHQESRSRRRKERRSHNKDHGHGSGQQDQEPMDVVSDGEVRTDEGAELEGLEGGRSQNQQNQAAADEPRNQAGENESNVEGGNREAGSEKQNTADAEKQKETSPETIRGSSESSTAKDDPPSGEEPKTDEDKVEGQRSPEVAADSGKNHQVIVPNPEAEASRSRMDELPSNQCPDNLSKSGETQEAYSDGEIVEDVTIVEDGEELIVLSSDEMEEGELSDSLSNVSSSEGSSLESACATSEDDLEEISVDSDSSGGLEVLKVDYPPCIRMIVTKSDTLRPGSLSIITCAGGTIGREGSSQALLIQSVKVSKRHAQIVYDSEERQYTIVDLGSQNGTLLNGKAISEQRVVSKPHPLSHRDYITIGGTTLRLHIHPGDETCEECEPGQVQALIALQQLNELSAGMPSGSKPDKEQQRRKELRHLKKKFNLAKEDYINQDPSLTNPAYGDRAGERRRTVGSDNPYQPDDQPASVDRAIGSTNLGHKMLSKMGWSEGQSLGKGDRGIKEPIQAVVHNRNAGLGSGMVQSMDQVQYSRRRHENWDKARGRFNLISPQQLGASHRGKQGPSWVQGGKESLSANPQHSSLEGRGDSMIANPVQLPLASRGKSQEIVEIWDESMEASSSACQSDSGRTPPGGLAEKNKDSVGGTEHPAAKDPRIKPSDLKYNHEEYERVFLGNETVERNSTGIREQTEVFPTVDSRSNECKLTKGVDSSKQIEQEESRSVCKDDSKIAEQLTNQFSDKEASLSMTTLDSTEKSLASISKCATLEATNADSEQNKETQENLGNAAEETESPLSQAPDRNHDVPAKESDMGTGKSDKLAVLSNPQAAESSDKGKKIQLKWNKGGKEKRASNLVAFEESESEGEEGDTPGSSKAAVDGQGQPKPHQGRGDQAVARRGPGRSSRWSKTKNSSGN